MSNPTANSLYSYEVMGEINIPLVSYDDANREVDITFALDQLFYPEKINLTSSIDECAPELIPGVSAFNIRLMNGGRPAGGFIAIVKELEAYSIRLDSTSGEYWVTLKFTFDKVATDYRSGDVPDIPLVMKDVLVHGDFIALFIGGDPEAVSRRLSNYRIFRHGDKVYHSYGATLVKQQVAADRDMLTICTVVYASTTEIPNKTEEELFGAMVSHYIDTVYRASEYK